jgi:cytochrome P450
MHLGVGNEAYTRNSVQTLDGEAHFERRRLLAPVFGPEARRHCELVTLPPSSARAVARAAERAGGAWPIDVDLVTVIRETIVQITGRLIGLDGPDEAAAVRRLLERSSGTAWRRATRQRSTRRFRRGSRARSIPDRRADEFRVAPASIFMMRSTRPGGETRWRGRCC